MLTREMKEYYNRDQWLNYIEHNMSNANIVDIAESIDCGFIVRANNGDTLAKFNEGYGYIFEGRKLDSSTPFAMERRRAYDF